MKVSISFPVSGDNCIYLNQNPDLQATIFVVCRSKLSQGKIWRWTTLPAFCELSPRGKTTASTCMAIGFLYSCGSRGYKPHWLSERGIFFFLAHPSGGSLKSRETKCRVQTLHLGRSQELGFPLIILCHAKHWVYGKNWSLFFLPVSVQVFSHLHNVQESLIQLLDLFQGNHLMCSCTFCVGGQKFQKLLCHHLS